MEGTSSASGSGTKMIFANVKDLLVHHSSKEMHPFSEYFFTVNRHDLWAGVMAFYKSGIANPQKLKQLLVVSFVGTGERGCDAGALQKEYFKDALCQANFRLFEGADGRRVPRKDVSLELSFEVAGMLFSQSILQKGCGMPCLSPAVYEYLTTGDYTGCYPTKSDIPLNISTHELITFIEEVCVPILLMT